MSHVARRDREREQEVSAEERRARRERAIVQVELVDVMPAKRAEIEALWDRREAKAAELREIRGKKPRNDAFAVPTSDQVYGEHRMVRGKGAPVKPPTKVTKTLGGDVVMAENPDATVSDGTTDDEGRAEQGEFVRKPQPREPRY
jgi:hypothetical protein